MTLQTRSQGPDRPAIPAPGSSGKIVQLAAESRLGREARKLATQVALRQAAVRLITERGYDATTTEDIARAANVSPRTFFNYFPTKESVVLLPEEFLPALVEHALRGRPEGEDPVASLAAAAMETVQVVEDWAQPHRELVLATFRIMLTERVPRQIMLERRARLEELAWQILQERGMSPHDTGLRAAVVTVISLGYLAIATWAESGAAEPLTAVLARYLLSAPEPARLTAGALAARREPTLPS